MLLTKAMKIHRFCCIQNGDFMAITTHKNEFGTINIADRALAAIAYITSLQMEGVVSMDPGLVADLTSMFGKEAETTGVTVHIEDDEVSVDLYIRVAYGLRVPDLALRLQEKVRSALETYAEVTVVAINVYVQGIIIDETEGSST